MDRETRDAYEFKIVAKDNGRGVRLSSTTDIEVTIDDVNDNAPTFYGYQEVGRLSNPPPEIIKANLQMLVPVFYASVPENSPMGTVVTRIHANDTDSPANGNGVILFTNPHDRREQQFFTIDSKEGVVTTTGQLDYEQRSVHNLTIVASDLGSPSLSSTAMLIVRILDVDEGLQDSPEIKRPTFQHRYYEVEVEENSRVPVKLLELNVTMENSRFRDDEHSVRYSIVTDNVDDFEEETIRNMFTIDTRSGVIEMLASPDREIRNNYEFKVRVDRVKSARGMPVMIYPVTGERLNGLAPNEAKVVIKVRDANDNSPKFKTNGRPILAAIPTTAHYGYSIIKVEVRVFMTKQTA